MLCVAGFSAVILPEIVSFESMKAPFALLLLLVFFTQTTLAQGPLQHNFTFKKAGEAYMSLGEDDFFPIINHLEAPAPGTESSRSYLMMLKQNMPAKRAPQPNNIANKNAGTAYTPFVLRNFKGNAYEGIPNDNSMAISNGGIIISAINSNVNVYAPDGELISNNSLSKIGEDLKLPGNKYDPRVIYDPAEDRFILTYLNGKSPTQSYLTLCFSKTNDPADGWNLYYLPGNPLEDDSWSDYPMISLTEGELFYSINLLKPNGSWQTSFKQTVIWQIGKADGYAGNDLQTKLWSDIKFGKEPIRNIYPVKGGSKLYGPNMYFLSDRNFDLENDTIFYMEITGKKDDANTKLVVDFLISDIKYGVPPNAAQRNTKLELQTNDARILDGFLEQNQIVFAANCIDTSNNYAAIYFGHISNVGNKPSLKGHIITNDSLEFGYPGLAFCGDENHLEAVLCMNFSSYYHYPGCGVMYYDGTNFSDFKHVKNGLANIQVIGGAERWGDYIGMQPKYDEIGICWMAGTFGKPKGGIGTEYGTWIAEIQKYGYNNITEPAPKTNISLFPNPVENHQIVTIEYDCAETDYLQYRIYNLSGQLVKTLLTDAKTKQGHNRFVFDVKSLAPGTYLITATGKAGNVFSEKFQVTQ